MYVDDISLEEAREYETLLTKRLRYARPGSPEFEQAGWDLEDIHRRIQELDPEEGTQ